MFLEIKTYQILDDQLLADWQRLWDESPCAHFFNSPQWFLACTKTFSPNTCQIITVYDKNGLATVLPLCVERKYGIKTFTSPGGKHLSKSTLLTRENSRAILLALASYLSKRSSYYLPEIDAETALIISQNNKAVAMREASVNPYISLSSDPFCSLSKKQHHKINNLVKKNQDHLTYCCFKGSEEGLKIAFAIDWNSSKRKEGKPAFAGQTDRQFFYQLLGSFGKQVVVDVLSYDGVPIVFSIGFVYKNVYHSCNTAYNDYYRRLSPRKLLLFFTLCRLQEEGARIFDFSRGVTTLKKEFTPLFYKQYNLYYAQNAFVKYWWDIANSVYNKLLGNKTFYQIYLVFKRLRIKFNYVIEQNYGVNKYRRI